jgi:uncharacterized protein (TIGR02466 family)
MKPVPFTPTFAQPIGVYDSGIDAAVRASLVAMLEELRLIPSGRRRSSVGGWRSEGNLFDVEVAAMRQLADVAVTCSFDFLRSCGVRFDEAAHTGRLVGWANINGRGHYNAPHRHCGYHLSGCFYLTQPSVTTDGTGVIEFLDQRTLSPQLQRFGGPVFSSSFDLRPEPGQIVIFPSFLTHWVRPNQSDEERIVIAWNLDVVERGPDEAGSPGG